jgi:hypothetical protein
MTAPHTLTVRLAAVAVATAASVSLAGCMLIPATPQAGNRPTSTPTSSPSSAQTADLGWGDGNLVRDVEWSIDDKVWEETSRTSSDVFDRGGEDASYASRSGRTSGCSLDTLSGRVSLSQFSSVSDDRGETVNFIEGFKGAPEEDRSVKSRTTDGRMGEAKLATFRLHGSFGAVRVFSDTGNILLAKITCADESKEAQVLDSLTIAYEHAADAD